MKPKNRSSQKIIAGLLLISMIAPSVLFFVPKPARAQEEAVSVPVNSVKQNLLSIFIGTQTSTSRPADVLVWVPINIDKRFCFTELTGTETASSCARAGFGTKNKTEGAIIEIRSNPAIIFWLDLFLGFMLF